MASPAVGLQDPYLSNLDLSISEHLTLYNKEIAGLKESDRCYFIISKWTGFYQE